MYTSCATISSGMLNVCILLVLITLKDMKKVY